MSNSGCNTVKQNYSKFKPFLKHLTVANKYWRKCHHRYWILIQTSKKYIGVIYNSIRSKLSDTNCKNTCYSVKEDTFRWERTGPEPKKCLMVCHAIHVFAASAKPCHRDCKGCRAFKKCPPLGVLQEPRRSKTMNFITYFFLTVLYNLVQKYFICWQLFDNFYSIIASRFAAYILQYRCVWNG